MRSTLSRLLPFLALTALVHLTCSKHPIQESSKDLAFLAAAREYFTDSVAASGPSVTYRASLNRQPQWDQAQFAVLKGGQGVLVPIVYGDPILMKANFVGSQFFHIDYLTNLWIYKDSSQRFKALVITSFPDSSFFKNPVGRFTGMKFMEDWQGHPVQKLLFLADGTVKKYVPANRQADALEIIQTCYSIEGYNYSPGSDETYSWSEDAGCSTSFIFAEDGFGGGGDGGPAASGGSSSAATTVTVLPGNSVIKNIKNYFQCFTNVGGTDHLYTVTVCVDQPDPGTRKSWTPSADGAAGSSSGDNPVDVGHVFLTLTEAYGSTTVTRNVGFYPTANVNPIDYTSQGTLNDDETHIFNISGSFSVTSVQFFNILNFISQGNTAGYLYNLNTNNCTTFVINAAAQGGINLPRTIGTWPGGTGNDPGDLGEDLRNNNIAGMTLNLGGGTDNSHLNVGQCN